MSMSLRPGVSVVHRLQMTCRYRVWRAGNRHTDVTSYQAVEIPDSRIMIINPQGEVHNPLNGQARISSYDGLRELCDLMFPPVVRRGGEGAAVWQGEAGGGVTSIPPPRLRESRGSSNRHRSAVATVLASPDAVWVEMRSVHKSHSCSVQCRGTFLALGSKF